MPTRNLTDFIINPKINKGSISADAIPPSADPTPANATFNLPAMLMFPSVPFSTVWDIFKASDLASANTSPKLSNPIALAAFSKPFKIPPVKPIALLILLDLSTCFSREPSNSLL